MGNTERAIREVRIAAALDPLSSRLAAAVGWTLVYAGQSDESIRQFQTVLTLDPDYEVAHAGLGRAYQLKGDYELSIDEMRWSFTRIGFPANEAKALESELRDAYRKLGSRGYWQKRLEWELEDVWDKHLVQRRHVPAYWVALDYANLGEKDRAFSWLQQAYQQHEPEFVTLKVDPRLDPLRSDPRFTELLRQVGLLQ